MKFENVIKMVPGVPEMKKFSVSEGIVERARFILAEVGELDRAVGIVASNDEIHAILSQNSEDMIPLQQIEHAGKVYYIGIPKDGG